MHGSTWIGVFGVALVIFGCSSETDGRNANGSVSSVAQAATSGARYMRVRVGYEAGKFQVERVTWVAGKLKQPRSGKARNPLRYVARAPGQASFLGSVPDPRSVHVEVPDGSGNLTPEATQPPGKQHFLIYVPGETETVDFEATASTSRTASAGTAQRTAQTGTLGTIDLRSFK